MGRGVDKGRPVHVALSLSLSLSLRACVFFNCQQLIPCRNVANSCALILGGAARQLPFTADERVYGRQLHYLFIIYDSISSDNGKEGGKKRSASTDLAPPPLTGALLRRSTTAFVRWHLEKQKERERE